MKTEGVITFVFKVGRKYGLDMGKKSRIDMSIVPKNKHQIKTV